MIRITHLMRVSDGPPVRWVGKTEHNEEVRVFFNWGVVLVKVWASFEASREVTWMLTQTCSDEALRSYLEGFAELPAVIDQATAR